MYLQNLSGSFPPILFAILKHYLVDALMQKSLKHPQVLEMIMELTEKHKIFEIQIILSCSKYVFKEETLFNNKYIRLSRELLFKRNSFYSLMQLASRDACGFWGQKSLQGNKLNTPRCWSEQSRAVSLSFSHHTLTDEQLSQNWEKIKMVPEWFHELNHQQTAHPSDLSRWTINRNEWIVFLFSARMNFENHIT